MQIITDFIPKPGDIIQHMLPSGQSFKYIWVICPKCLGGRWVRIYQTKLITFTGLCKKCNIKARKVDNWSRSGYGR